MTLINCVYAPTGIIMSGDSRTTLTLTGQQNYTTNIVQSDATNKIFQVLGQFGVGTFGTAHINNLPIEHYIKEFEARNPNISTTQQLATDLLAYFRTFNPVPDVGFLVAGYSQQLPYVYSISVVNNTCIRVNEQNQIIIYGAAWSGDIDIINRLLSQQQSNPIYDYFNLQDAIDFSRHLIRTTIDQLRFEPRFPTVGGNIDSLAITPSKSFFVAKKELRA
jgi:hypothetical protein